MLRTRAQTHWRASKLTGAVRQCQTVGSSAPPPRTRKVASPRGRLWLRFWICVPTLCQSTWFSVRGGLRSSSGAGLVIDVPTAPVGGRMAASHRDRRARPSASYMIRLRRRCSRWARRDATRQHCRPRRLRGHSRPAALQRRQMAACCGRGARASSISGEAACRDQYGSRDDTRMPAEFGAR